MNTVQRIAKNTGILFSAQIIACILGFFYSIYMARYLGPVGFGVLSFAIALILIFGVFGDLGLSTLLTRELSKDKSLEEKYIGNFIPIKIILSILKACQWLLTDFRNCFMDYFNRMKKWNINLLLYLLIIR
jgi:O-antigen/teichoic acid export membrane protein